MWLSEMIDDYPAGYIEILSNVVIQVVYLTAGLMIECFRPTYKSRTSWRMLRQSLRNHALAVILHVAFVTAIGGRSVLSRTFSKPFNLPQWREVVSDLVIGVVLREVIFYFIHRFWHFPSVYERVHAKHHEILDPAEHHVWITSYMTYTDFLFLYGLPVLAVIKLLEMNIVTTMLFSLVAAMGEPIQLIVGNDIAHDEHHKDGSVNFGSYGFMDSLFGTYSGV